MNQEPAPIKDVLPKPILSRYNMSFVFHLAAEYRERFSVVPLFGKMPAIPWKRLQSERPTLGEVVTWWGANAKEQYNIGIVMGRVSGIVVVDADDAKTARWWSVNYPQSPLAVRTPNGAHFYYRTPPDQIVRTRIRALGKRLDIKGEGSVVTAPPSVVDGKSYVWCGSFDSYAYEELPVFDPKWVEPSKPNQRSGQRQARAGIDALRERVGRVHAISGQGGHNATFHVACLLLPQLGPNDALAELRRWSLTNAHPPWSEKELRWKIASAAKHLGIPS